jgi:hypothetical protein
MYGRAKLTIDFFSIVPCSTGTASSGFFSLGRSEATCVQIYAWLTSLKWFYELNTHNLCDASTKDGN